MKIHSSNSDQVHLVFELTEEHVVNVKSTTRQKHSKTTSDILLVTNLQTPPLSRNRGDWVEGGGIVRAARFF